MKLRLADRDERRDRIAHDRQLHQVIETLRNTSGFERKRRNFFPRNDSCHRTIGQNRNGKSFVFAISFTEPIDVALLIDVFLSQSNFGFPATRFPGRMDRRDDQHRCGNVGIVASRVPPASVFVLLRLEPAKPLVPLLLDHRGVGWAWFVGIQVKGIGTDRCRGGKRRG